MDRWKLDDREQRQRLGGCSKVKISAKAEDSNSSTSSIEREEGGTSST